MGGAIPLFLLYAVVAWREGKLHLRNLIPEDSKLHQSIIFETGHVYCISHKGSRTCQNCYCVDLIARVNKLPGRLNVDTLKETV
jgi:hypothetical protein